MFKVGDKVRVLKNCSAHGYEIGEIGVITQLGSQRSFRLERPGSWMGCSEVEHLEWQPTQGELVEVRDRGYAEWVVKVFVAEYKGKFIVVTNPETYHHYDEIRQLKETHTMILDGEETEISEEVYQQLKGGAK